MLLMALFRRGVGNVLTTITLGPGETVEPRPLHAKKVFFILLRTAGHMTPYIHGLKALLQ